MHPRAGGAGVAYARPQDEPRLRARQGCPAVSARACAGHTCDRPPALYRPRHPERTVVRAVVREHLETWLARQREGEREVPGFVERDFRKAASRSMPAIGSRPRTGRAWSVSSTISRSPRPTGASRSPSAQRRRPGRSLGRTVEHAQVSDITSHP